jgi:hypothetical protein
LLSADESASSWLQIVLDETRFKIGIF